MALQNDEEVRAALAEWSRHGAARRDTSKLTIESIENKGPVQILLTSIFEQRGVSYDLSPAPSRSRSPQHPDPWDHPFKFAEGDEAPIGAKLAHPLDEVAVHMGCDVCGHSGAMRCASCDGDGRRSTHNGGSRRCYTCSGTGVLTCDTCAGSGALYGKPTLWAAIESVCVTRLVEADDLPNSVFLLLSEAPMDGDVVHRQEGALIEDLRALAHRGAGAYRDSADEGPTAITTRELCKNPGTPEDVRVLRQELELRRVDVWELKAREVQTFWLVGDPIQVLPAKVLNSPLARIAWITFCVLLLALVIGLANYLR